MEVSGGGVWVEGPGPCELGEDPPAPPLELRVRDEVC